MFKKVLCTRGQAMVEFAIVLPIFLLLVFGMIQFGLVLHDYLTINEVAREGARIAAVGTDITKANLDASVSNRNIIFTESTENTDVKKPDTVVVNHSDGTTSTYDAVTITIEVMPRDDWTLPFLRAFWPTWPTPIRESVTMRLE